MSKGGNSTGLSKLAALFKETAKGEIPTNPPLELGTINDDYSLTTDSFPIAIPVGDYLVSRHLKQWTTEEAEDHKHHIPGHNHTADDSTVSLTTNDAGGHGHSIAAHNHGGAVSAQALSADNNGSHSHGINGHNHTVTIGDTEQDTEDAGKHSHTFPEGWTLKKGDRVLVAWAKNDAVVIDVIIQATEVFK